MKQNRNVSYLNQNKTKLNYVIKFSLIECSLFITLLLVLIPFLGGGRGKGVGRWGGGVRLFEAGRQLTFSAFRMGGYSRWALIRGWLVIKNPLRVYSLSQIYLRYTDI